MTFKHLLLVIILASGTYELFAQLTPIELQRRKFEKLNSTASSPRSNRSGGAPEQDCNSAIPICQNTLVQPTAYSGFGMIQEVPTSSCLGSQEKNAVWYTFTVESSGTLNFTIDPNDDNDDYDFALYDLTGKNCTDIPTGVAPEVRCNFCVDPGNTGLSAAGVNNSEDCCTNSPGCQFSNTLNATTGQTYVLIVSNYSSSQSGYTLTFSGTAGIFGATAPVSITTPCGGNSLTLQMSRAVLCSSIAPDGSEFIITGPAGPFTVTGAAGVNCGNATSQLSLNFFPPLIIDSNYTLMINNGTDGNTLIDNCGNVLTPGTILNFTAVPPPANIFGLDEVCSGNPDTLLASAGTAYSWSTGDTTRSIVVSPLSTTTYSVTVTNGNCTASDTLHITVKPGPTAGFTVSPNPAHPGQPVQFTNTSTCDSCMFPPFNLWDFGDSVLDNTSNPTHTYSLPGTFDVSLTSTDLFGGCSNEIIIQVEIIDSCSTQNISLASGWNIISGYIIPDIPDIENVFGAIVSNIILVKNSTGQTYIPALNINSIANWDFRQGYKVKTNTATTLTLGCTIADPGTPVPLVSGWNMIPYLRTTPMDAAVALASLGSDILIMKNNTGLTYIPGLGINTIGNMQPGQGYQLKLLNTGVLTYPQ